ncbi:MAG: xanthan lyase [Microbacter sp.]
MNIRRFYFLSIFYMAVSVVSNADVFVNSALSKAVSDTLTFFLQKQIAGRTTVKKLTVDKKNHSLTVTMDESLAYLPLKEDEVDRMYQAVQSLLPDSLQKYRLTIISDDLPIQQLVPNVYRKAIPKDKSRIYANKKEVFPLTRNLSKPFLIKKGLQDKHIAMWQSHGLYFNQIEDRWQWQRARLLQTVEDLYTQSYVLPYLVPMLENAGANVLLPRERDYHRTEVIVDNDTSDFHSKYREIDGKEHWITGDSSGFAHRQVYYVDGQNPFRSGTYRQTETIKKGKESLVEWIPDMPEAGHYAVYVSYKTLPKSSDDALYTVYHLGGKTQFKVNQQMGGGTWIFLGFFPFPKGISDQCKITLSNISHKNGDIVTADAVKIGGGMGNIARIPNANGDMTENKKSSDTTKTTKIVQPSPIHYTLQTSGYPRYTEGARYWLQWAGMPDSIYNKSGGKNDYTDDFQSRGFWVNYLAGGSHDLPKVNGLHIPVDLAFAFHSDAGTTMNDSIIGTLGIYMTHINDAKFADGESRQASRDLTEIVMDEVVNDIRRAYEPKWTRRAMWDRSYSEARVPEVPTMLLELLAHQNFADMRYGLDPRFRFTVSRAIYKGMLKFIAGQYGYKYVVEPLPVSDFSALLIGQNQVQLKWKAVNDSLEITAKPKHYVVYTRINHEGFDNGQLVNDTTITLAIPSDSICSFKVTAVNDGGESFPSEMLSVCDKSNSKGSVLIVNGFDRLSAPASFETNDSLAGFLDCVDHGVPDHVQYNYVGSMYEFRRQKPWISDDSPGFGASNANDETKVIAGNSFDYPFVHGEAIAHAGYSFVSCSKASVCNGETSLNDYPMVDLILGKERETVMGRGARPAAFKTFPKALQEAISGYCRSGGHIFISGAYVGTDLWDNPLATDSDRTWAQNVLKFKWVNDCGAVDGKFEAAPSPFAFSGQYTYYHQLNGFSYVVEQPNAIDPVGKDAFTIFRYSANRIGAGVAYRGSYKTCILGVPFETVMPEERNAMMQQILNFFTGK